MRLTRRFVIAILALSPLASLPAAAADWDMPGMSGMSASPWTWAAPGMAAAPQQAGSALGGMAAQLPEWANSAAQAMQGQAGQPMQGQAMQSLPGQAAQSMQGFIPWGQGNTSQANLPWGPAMSNPAQPDLSGSWRGSGGEYVEIRRNNARIWGGDQQYCDCIFMIHGNRLIAYSPDTDVVRKYEFATSRDRFALRDERGETMVFMRAR